MKNSSNKKLAGCALLIKELVEVKGYSYSRIAKRCGASPSGIRSIATGVIENPKIPLVRKILALYCKVFYGAEKRDK